MTIVVLYLAAIVAANLSVAQWGPGVSIINAFLFIGLDLTTRDVLHARWQGRGLWVRMLALIAVGGALSWVLNRDAAQIAVASCAAFVAAGFVDTVAYQVLRRRSPRQRVSGSNVCAAAVDSLLFPTVAFGAFMPAIVVGQFIAKVAGGAIWYEVFRALPVRFRPSGEARDAHA
jgi:hypothetical protein